MTPQEQARREAAGEARPWGYNSWSSYRNAQMQGDRGPEGVDLFGGAPIWTITAICFPFLILAAAAFLFGGWLMDHHVGYREVLETIFPGEAIAATTSEDGSPGLVAAVVAGAMGALWLGLRIARWAWLRTKVRSERAQSRIVVIGLAFVLAVAATTTMVALGPLAIVGGAIAQADDLRSADPGDGAPARTMFGLLISGVGIVFWAGRSTLRSLNRAFRQAEAQLDPSG